MGRSAQFLCASTGSHFFSVVCFAIDSQVNVIAECSEANNRAVCVAYVYIHMYIMYIYIYLQVWPRAPGEPPSTVRGSAW